MQIRELDLRELLTAYEVVSQLRTTLTYDEFEDLIYEMRSREYKMFGIMDGEKLITYAGVAIQTNLYHKRHLYVFDLVTDEKYRDKKYGAMMLEYLNDFAKMGMCENIVLSSGIQREDAHRFYEKSGFAKKSFVFLKSV
ncbi:MAG: GNAT family N-acetyltransferase [Sulfurimonas sp. RIFCSPHIGHO2_12_FULL_36_9]|uniref:GNAT family N-acetyltransferase n=1 Tax=Sulfurimonas sp. RIFCSPLOWO2_12_36_12 TaxID=1802253 RepID=UPI0008B833B0|nr:GNAT family N-acetyltransferase [Sulfurimonas sp. RIFCSPLOWO2_12_36_12]OHD97316.1 MAG: GNAT family N-acetyltransferase [Sulfurimonas sp. RIFCSPHIGHO2_12_FULL_36_9]OHE00469.1 MAG: GNAT family N-acetyltransferase [Sulfurimonas sp. RIFCSPLOWO2_12_36_12]OHE06132.1 MAG: GNAT family N-acetyltransferase [Sulfurimonas sp. RIFCSPLOWO2_12_FULL_36_74]